MIASSTLKYFLPYQVQWINDGSRTAIAEKSRRVGFTYAESYRSVERRVRLGTHHYFASRDLESAKLFLDDCKTFVRVLGVVAEDLGEQVIDSEKDLKAFVLQFANGARIMALSSNPDVFRSKGGDITLDEFAFHKSPSLVLKAANASAKIWGHQIRIISTHNGETHLFNRLILDCRQGKHPGWGLHRVTLADAVAQGLVEKIQKLSGPDEIKRADFLEDVRSDCVTPVEWAEEYCCQPSAESGSLLSYDLLGGCERPAESLRLATSPEQLEADGSYYAGFDVGRKHDLSVLWVLAKLGDVYETRMLRELSRENFTAQEGLINVLMANRAVKRICIDETGIGMMLAERAVQRWGSRAEAVTFTQQTKMAMGMPLLRLFQDKLVRIPAIDAVREDLHKVRRETTAAGNVRLVADSDDDGHADRFWALALAAQACDSANLPLPAPMRHKPRGW